MKTKEIIVKCYNRKQLRTLRKEFISVASGLSEYYGTFSPWSSVYITGYRIKFVISSKRNWDNYATRKLDRHEFCMVFRGSVFIKYFKKFLIYEWYDIPALSEVPPHMRMIF